MSKTSTQLFKMLSPEGEVIPPGFLQRHVQPVVGERITVLNFPDVLHFVVEDFKISEGDAGQDFVEPSTIVLRRDAKEEMRLNLVDRKLPATNIANRIKAMLPDAQLTMPEKLLLRLTPGDLVDLCASEGIAEADCEVFDALAYEDVPLVIVTGEDSRSEFNGYTRVDGEIGGFARLYLSRIDGQPFRIDPMIGKVCELYFAELLSREKTTSSLFDLVVRLDTSLQGDRALDKIAEALTLIDLNMLSPRLAAQELTDLMHRIWQEEILA